MTTALVFVVISVILLFGFSALVFQGTRGVPGSDLPAATLQSLDVESFRNLMDPNEEDFLRASLPHGKFRTIQRERARAALAYVQELSRAGLQFARIGDIAQRSADPEVATWGKQLAISAVDLRLSTLRTSVHLRLAAVFPGLRLRRSTPLFEHYDRAARLVLKSDVAGRVPGVVS